MRTFKRSRSAPQGVEHKIKSDVTGTAVNKTDAMANSTNIEQECPISYQVFPNPFVDQLTIKFSEQSTSPTFLAMYSITGQLVWESTYPANISEVKLFDFKQVKTGKYILHVLYKGKPYVEGIVKE